jgi:Fe-S oxidoreductase
VDQLLEATPDTIAISCPFCMIMMDDTIKGKNLDERAKVKDFIALVPESLQERVKD